MGAYGKCLDVKLTNKCNASCEFCIEKNGYTPAALSVESLIFATNNLTEYENVLVLGGEPMLYEHLEEYLAGIKPCKKNIYMTTNGSQLDLLTAEMLSKYLTAINISVHHSSELINDKVYHTHVSLNNIAAAISVFNHHNVPVRINCNLVKGTMEDEFSVRSMILWAAASGANEIRFAELQYAEDVFVDAHKLFPGLTNDPYTDGCEQEIAGYPIKVKVKLTCGIVNKLRQPSVRPDPANYTTKVVYPNATAFDGWLTKLPKTSKKSSGGMDTLTGSGKTLSKSKPSPRKTKQPVDDDYMYQQSGGCHGYVNGCGAKQYPDIAVTDGCHRGLTGCGSASYGESLMGCGSYTYSGCN
jgi:organic radical activating enzyme